MAHHAWTQAHVRRLFWRAGFGATPARGPQLGAGRARRDAPARPARRRRGLRGPAAHASTASRSTRSTSGATTSLWWLDRMVRSRPPLEEKLTLFWHDHFATSDQDTPLMLRPEPDAARARAGQLPGAAGRRHARPGDAALPLARRLRQGRAQRELRARADGALHARRSGYTERDIREAARALTGFQSHWGDNGFNGITYDAERHDAGREASSSARRGASTGTTCSTSSSHHPRHAPFLVSKLWDFFVTEPPGRATRARPDAHLSPLGLRIKPVVAEILGHRALYRHLDAPDMVKCAGRLRGRDAAHHRPGHRPRRLGLACWT